MLLQTAKEHRDPKILEEARKHISAFEELTKDSPFRDDFKVKAFLVKLQVLMLSGSWTEAHELIASLPSDGSSLEDWKFIADSVIDCDADADLIIAVLEKTLRSIVGNQRYLLFI
jgi:hypothetical protein